LSDAIKRSTTSDEVVDILLLELLMRMWGGLLTRVTPSLFQVMVGRVVAELTAVQYSWITDLSTTL